MCVSIFSTTFVWNFFHSKKIERDMIKDYIGPHVKHTLLLSDFNKTWICSTDFRKMFKYQISLKSVQWEPNCYMRTGGQTDSHDEANSSFSKICASA